MTETRILQDRGAVATEAAREFVAAATAAALRDGWFAVALSGGSTPRDLYGTLASEACAGRVDWRSAHVFWGDERCVPPDDPASNFGMARSTLLRAVPIPERNVHRIEGERRPAGAASDYERLLRSFFRGEDGGAPNGLASKTRFDLVLLGMGADGHTASLFPGTTALRERERWVVAHEVAADPAWRVTLTPVVLNAAARLLFLVSGRDKAGLLREVLEGPRCPERLPAQAIVPTEGDAVWLVDGEAGAELSGGRAAGDRAGRVDDRARSRRR